MPGKCQFREYWLTNPKHKDVAKWLRPVKQDKYRAACSFCKTSFDVSHSGYSSVTSHENGKIHQELAKALLTGKQTILSFKASVDRSTVSPLLPVASSAVTADESVLNLPPSSSVNTASAGSGLDRFVIKDEVTRAEVVWAINKVMSHSSDRGASSSSDLFPIMFPDSTIAKHFKMHKDKLAYTITYGLGPFFQNSLMQELNGCEFYCVAFDESLNKIAQKGQMDIIVRYWNSVSSSVSTRYLTSVFLGHSTALDLFNGFTSSLDDLGVPLRKIMQISMDGPNVNLKFLKDFQFHMKAQNPNSDDQEIIDLGTCSLHIVHGCYKTALQKSEWGISKFLRAIYYLFRDFPSRRADYLRYSGSSIFPKKLCSVRWVENSGVIERALKMLPHLKKYVAAVKTNPPASHNFLVVQQFLEDPLLLAKLSFLQSVCVELEPFLTDFQSDNPLLPFLYDEMYYMTRNIASRFLLPDLMQAVKNGTHLLAIDAQKKESQMLIKDVVIGFGATAACKRAKELHVVTFKRDCRDFLISIFVKLVNPKSPLRKAMVRGASCLSPAVMMNSSIRTSRVTVALNELVSKNYVAPIEADLIKKSYLALCEQQCNRAKLQSFNWKKDRLDVLITNLTGGNEADPFFKFVQKILGMFHGNAAVERGFSINKDCLVENLHENSLVAQRSVYSAVASLGGVQNVNVNKTMLTEVRKAASRRKEALVEQKNQKDQEADKVKRAAEEIAKLKERKRKLLEKAGEEADALEAEIKAVEKKKKY